MTELLDARKIMSKRLEENECVCVKNRNRLCGFSKRSLSQTRAADEPPRPQPHLPRDLHEPHRRRHPRHALRPPSGLDILAIDQALRRGLAAQDGGLEEGDGAAHADSAHDHVDGARRAGREERHLELERL